MSVVATIAATPVLAAIAIEDLRHHRIRNRYILALAAVAVTPVLISALNGDRALVGRAALGAVLGSAPLAASWGTRPSDVGGGDVKLAATLGALVGIVSPWLSVAVIGFGLLISAAAAIALRRPRVPLAPAMTLAALVLVIAA